MYDDEHQHQLAPRQPAALTPHANALATSATTAIQARYVVAAQFPRQMVDVREQLLEECRRPAFAARALYRIPFGGKATVGPSIRFAEALLRCYGHIHVESEIVHEDDDALTLRVTITDLQRNLSIYRSSRVPKTVERAKANGRVVVASRKTSEGRMVHIVRATDQELAAALGSAESKAMRTLVLRLVPAHLVDEALDVVEATRQSDDDPDDLMRRLERTFSTHGVTIRDVLEFAGVERVAQLSKGQIGELRQIAEALNDGMATWSDYAGAVETVQPAAAPQPQPKPKRRSRASDMRDALLKGKGASEGSSDPDPNPNPEPDDSEELTGVNDPDVGERDVEDARRVVALAREAGWSLDKLRKRARGQRAGVANLGRLTPDERADIAAMIIEEAT